MVKGYKRCRKCGKFIAEGKCGCSIKRDRRIITK